MESSIYRDEVKKLLLKKVAPEEIRNISGNLFNIDRIKQLFIELCESSGEGIALSEYVRVFVGITGQTNVDENQFFEFLNCILSLQKEIKNNQSLIDYYRKQDTEDRALPIPAIVEIAQLILIALATGVAQSLGNILVRKLLSRIKKSKKSDIFLQMLSSSPILSRLSEHASGLSLEQIAGQIKMAVLDIEVILERYENKKWVIKEIKNNNEIWKLHKDNVKRDFGL